MGRFSWNRKTRIDWHQLVALWKLVSAMLPKQCGFNGDCQKHKC